MKSLMISAAVAAVLILPTFVLAQEFQECRTIEGDNACCSYNHQRQIFEQVDDALCLMSKERPNLLENTSLPPAGGLPGSPGLLGSPGLPGSLGIGVNPDTNSGSGGGGGPGTGGPSQGPGPGSGGGGPAASTPTDDNPGNEREVGLAGESPGTGGHDIDGVANNDPTEGRGRSDGSGSGPGK